MHWPIIPYGICLTPPFLALSSITAYYSTEGLGFLVISQAHQVYFCLKSISCNSMNAFLPSCRYPHGPLSLQFFIQMSFPLWSLSWSSYFSKCINSIPTCSVLPICHPCFIFYHSTYHLSNTPCWCIKKKATGIKYCSISISFFNDKDYLFETKTKFFTCKILFTYLFYFYFFLNYLSS